MTNKTTKRALLASIVSLVLCFSMLLGTTYAWFTDSAVSGRNTIRSGNLDVVLEYKTSVNGTWAPVTENTKLFKEGALYEPGYTEVVFLRVSNAGSLALKYNLNVDVYGETKSTNVDDEPFSLKDYLEIGYYCMDESMGQYLLGIMFGTREDALSNVTTTKISAYDGVICKDQPLPKGDGFSPLLVALVLTMPESVGNEANHKTGVAAPTIDLGVSLLATQYTDEKDSFDNQYDKDAEYPELDTADVWDGTVDTTWYNDTDTEFTLDTAEQLAGLAKLVDGGNTFAGKTIKLGADVDLASLPFNPIGHSSNGKSFNGTFDGQGHTISNMYEQSDLSAWQYEGEYYGLFAYTNGATIKNVTIADAYISSGRNEAAGVVGNAVDTTFSDITISNTTLIAYNNSAGGVAAECYGNCSFTNITVDEDTVIGPLWGTYDVRLGGVVGLVHAGNNVTFKDITVACQLDAINDVAANYQYWLYRYSGMLIGHVDGVNGVADPTGYVTCENVTVIYDDWVNYHYCEDADLGAGSYNGPGEYKYARVEAGTGTDGIDLSACNHNADESHNVLIVFDQLFGGGQGVSGLKTYDGVTVVYPNN